MLSTNLYVPLFATIIWILGAFVAPFFIWQKHQMVLRVSVVMTVTCLYLSWASMYCFQLNPLIGPQMPAKMLLELAKIWRN